MFGFSNLNIYGLQQSEINGMKVPVNILEKFIKSEMIVGAEIRRDCGEENRLYNRIAATTTTTTTTTNNNNKNIKNEEKYLKNGGLNGLKLGSIEAYNKKIIERIANGGTLDRNSNEVIINSTPNTADVLPPPSAITPSLKTSLSSSPPTINAKDTHQSRKNLEMQKRKCMQMISFLDQQNQRLEKELAKEKRRRAEELSRIIKSLLCFEAKLKHDKKVINQKLYDKDTEICRLVSLNKVLKDKCGANLDLDEIASVECQTEALFCPNCRKKFYGIDYKENWTQTNKDSRVITDDQTEHGSSSDETLSSSFYGARRSIRYTSRRTFGTFRDYMRSRCMNIDDANLDNSEENASTLSRDESQYSYGKTNPFSRAIDRLHGIRRVESFDGDLDSESDIMRKNFSSGPDEEHSAHEEDVFIMTKNKSCSAREFAETSPKQEFETSTDDWYASASDADDNDVHSKPYAYNAVNPVLECVNQILLQQSMEESLHDGPPSLDSNGNNSGSGSSNKDGTVSRKRVHFSTKNNMVHVPRDENSSPTTVIGSNELKDNSFNYESIYSNEYEPIGSEQNSSNLYVDMESKLSQDDRIIIQERPKQPPALPPKPANLMKFKRVLRIMPQPCLTKELEMKNNEDDDNDNDDNSNNNKNNNKNNDDDKLPSEPDYCSISEVNETITTVQIIADIHKVPEDDSFSSQSADDIASEKTDEVEEIFADIPKLPNVAAIIAPKAITKFISHDNYITKSPSPPSKDEIPQLKQHQQQYVPNILAEINKKISTSIPPTTPIKSLPSLGSPNKKSTNPFTKVTSEDKLPLQAEFDWYNLDAEYGKSNQPDVIKATDVMNLEFHHDEMDVVVEGNVHLNHSVEYNLDEEFSLSNQPDIIKENVLETTTTTTTAATITTTTTTMMNTPPTTICEGFPTIVDSTPSSKIKVKTNFSSFIDSSGLSTKPLPRQRKIYFSGPFV